MDWEAHWYLYEWAISYISASKYTDLSVFCTDFMEWRLEVPVMYNYKLQSLLVLLGTFSNVPTAVPEYTIRTFG